MRKMILKKIKMTVFILTAFILIAIFGFESANADSTHMDGKGDSFVLGKGGSRMKLTSHNNIQVVVVGKLGEKYVAMLDYNQTHSKLNGKLFLVDNICVGSSNDGDGVGTCSWDGNNASIIDIEGTTLDKMSFSYKDPRKYMQIFWFDMREKFGDKPELWAVNCSSFSHHCRLFKYKETYDKGSNSVTKRTLQYWTYWDFGHIVRGIDVLDLNSLVLDPAPQDRRCPPIFVEVSRPSGNDGAGGDFWGVSSEVIFHNILMKDGKPNKDSAFGSYKKGYDSIATYDSKKIIDAMDNKHGKSRCIEGICGGGVSVLGTYADTKKPTLTYHTLEAQGTYKISEKHGGGDPVHLSWYICSKLHQFEYDKQSGKFIKLHSGGTGGYWEMNESAFTNSEIYGWLADFKDTCDSIFFHNRGPAMALYEYDLNIKGNGITGNVIRGGVRSILEKKSGNKCFVGKLKVTDNNKGELIEKDEYKSSTKGEALRRCDEQGRQVSAIFLGYPVTAVHKNTPSSSVDRTELFVNYEKVKTNGVETGSGVNTELSSGFGHESKILPVGYHVGYQGFLNNTVKKHDSSSFTGNLKISKKFNNYVSNYRNKGTIFFSRKVPVLVSGELVWHSNQYAEVKGLGTIVPISGGVRPDDNADMIDISHFDLYDPSVMCGDYGSTYSAMTAGLEDKSSSFNNRKGNLFEFTDESDLSNQVNATSNANYKFLDELKTLANSTAASDKDTFKDRPVKWLTPDSPGKSFGYGWKADYLYQMQFSKFKNKDDIAEQGHGGYWKFKVGLSENAGNVTARSTSRTYTNDTTKNGYGFLAPAVDYTLSKNYTLRYWGFNVNPHAYKQMQINNYKTPERPGFIPQYCWDRDQSFVLFVPEVSGCTEHMSLL